MKLTSFELTLVLTSILKVDHSIATLGIVFPFSDVHVAIWIFAKAIAVKLSILELTLIANAAIFDEHAQAVVFTSGPLALIVLSFILPNVDAIAIKVVFVKFTLKPVSTLFKDEDTKAMHTLLKLSCFVSLIDLPYVFTLCLIKRYPFDVRLIKNAPNLPILIRKYEAGVKVVLSEYDMQLFQVQLRPYK